jgi:hydrogenase maturation protein HypF
LPGGTQAIRQPWRNSFSHLHSAFGWEEVVDRWGALESIQWLNQQPVTTLIRMIESGLNSPLSSSCGRLFDGVAGLLNICRESISYEGQAAIELEAAAVSGRREELSGYPLQIDDQDKLLQLDPISLWQGMLDDLQEGAAVETIAWRFHLGIATAISQMSIQLAEASGVRSIALSGGVFQNKTLFELVADQLSDSGLNLLSHSLVPANDGGLALGQAVIGLAKLSRV